MDAVAHYVLPALAVVFAWWFSTGLILLLDGLPRRTFGWSLAGATAVLAAGLWGLAATADDASVAGAYIAFLAALAVWGWNEAAFLLGYVTGPAAVGDDGTAWRRFVNASRAILWHELAILASGLVVFWLAGGGANTVGAWTFAILWAMRLSAKLNVFLGVPNLSEEFLPEHLAHLKRYFRRRPMNLLFPFSVTAATVLVMLLAGDAASAATPAAAVGATLLAALAGLALLEHWLLVLPVPDQALWQWALAPRRDAAPDEDGDDKVVVLARRGDAAGPHGEPRRQIRHDANGRLMGRQA